MHETEAPTGNAADERRALIAALQELALREPQHRGAAAALSRWIAQAEDSQLRPHDWSVLAASLAGAKRERC